MAKRLPLTAGRLAAVALGLWALASPVLAQQSSGPMSAIDWLSDTVTDPAPMTETPAQRGPEPEVSGAAIEAVTVQSLDEVRADGIGLLSTATTGLPKNLWGASKSETIVRRITDERADMLPALHELLVKVLLADLDPPSGDEGRGEAVFLARVDKLVEMGALDQAYALLDRAGPLSPEIMRRWFDVALLIEQENAVCDVMARHADLTPTYAARVFCLARAERWEDAVLMLNNARALGLISDGEDALLARFLDPDLFEGEPPLPAPDQMTPLDFRLLEAIGEPVSTVNLPLAYAQSDLRMSTGWKAQLAAGERLARTGAVSDNQLLGLYTERRASASGGVWERVKAVQTLEDAMGDGSSRTLGRAVVTLWDELSAAEVEVPISRIHGANLARRGLSGKAGDIAYRMGLLTEDYERIGRDHIPRGKDNGFLASLATGAPDESLASSEAERAVVDGFAMAGAPDRLAAMVAGNKLGEALLRALTLFNDGARGDLDQVSDAIGLLRAVGLEDIARRASLEFLILDRRG